MQRRSLNSRDAWSLEEAFDLPCLTYRKLCAAVTVIIACVLSDLIFQECIAASMDYGFKTRYVPVPAPPPNLKIVGCKAPERGFEIQRFEVTNTEYASFLNAVARESDPQALYSPLMSQHFWGGILRREDHGRARYFVRPGYERLPVTFVSWLSAARYANWLAFGRPDGIEAALPLPTFNRIGLAVAACDSADVNVAVEDVPAIRALVVAAAGENGHRTSLSALERLSISKSTVISS